MKKMKFFAVMSCLLAVAAIALTSCTKTEDVNMDEAEAPVVIEYAKTAPGWTGALPCPYCVADNHNGHEHHGSTTYIHTCNPGDTCVHTYHKEQTCIYGPLCSHHSKCHHHIFWNRSHDGNTHHEETTHCGGTVATHGHSSI